MLCHRSQWLRSTGWSQAAPSNSIRSCANAVTQGTELSIWVLVGDFRTLFCDSDVSPIPCKQEGQNLFWVTGMRLLLTPKAGCMNRWGQDLTFSWLSLPLASPCSHPRGKPAPKIHGYFLEGMAGWQFFNSSS